MNKIILMLMIFILLTYNMDADLSAQNESNTDKFNSLAVGMNKIYLTDKNYSIMGNLVENDNFILKNEKFKVIRIAGTNIYAHKKEQNKNKRKGDNYKYLGMVQAGFCLPTGTFGDYYKTSSGFQVAGYYSLNKVIGMGVEYQYNNFHGTIKYNTLTYSYTKIETESYNSNMIKYNLIFGMLKKEYKAAVYFLIGMGVEFYSRGYEKATVVTYNSSQDYPISGDNGNSLIYGFGPGIFFKTSKMIGINMEAQFNKLLHTENHGNYEVSGGFFSLKAGIIYTIF